ncbi:MAG: SRPBCC family protein [Gammaproteobacteria bacterium]|nr:SRPBCC family protein [Gammaproteobacteria bacterium]
MTQFELLTRWLVPAPINVVWDALHDVGKWPSWWRYVKQVQQIEAGDTDGIGSIQRFVWATRLPYRVSFDMRTTQLQRPFLIEGHANGDLDGTGRWQLRTVEGSTLVRYEWRVKADKAWMKALAPLLRPLYVWNHNGVMAAGEEGLRNYLRSRRASGAR